MVKTLTGKTLNIEVDCATTTVRELKELVQDREGIPPDRQRMITAGRAMSEDDWPLAAYGLRHWSTVHLVLRLRGAPASLFLDPPHASAVPWPSKEEMDRFMKCEWAELVARGGEEGVHALRPPSETDCSFLAFIEGPAGSLYEGGKFVVRVGLASAPLVRVLTPLFHPAVATNGQIALLDGTGKGFVPWRGAGLPLLRALRAQLLVTDIGPEREAALARDPLVRLTQCNDWGPEMPQRRLRAERRARVTTALCAMTDHDRRTTSAWLAHFIPHSPQLCGEVKALLLVTAKHEQTGEPLHPEAGPVACLPAELVRMVVHHLALAHVAPERTQLVGRHHQGAAPESEWLPTKWRSPPAL